MKSVLQTLLVVLALALAGLAQAAPTATGNGYYGSVTWWTGWGNPLVTHSVGPYATYGDCYTAWMALAHSNPQWFVETVKPCTLQATHQELLTLEFSISFGDSGTPVGSVAELNAVADAIKPGTPSVLQIEREGTLLYLSFRQAR